ncbi:MAG: glycoside hydrolase family 38 C-terminal domain-containing protein [Candidatus Cloacimonetes bacterium]|nr:glycoside hydrolase family 38 C-terminal domain-containing protein [Candidatus Cloacimonadota bacterium]
MHNEKIILERIKKHIARHKADIYHHKLDINATYIYNQAAPIPYAELDFSNAKAIKKGDLWAEAWGSAWFLFKGDIPGTHRVKNCGLWLDFEGEACVFKDGVPWQGLTPKVDWYHNAAKHFVPLDPAETYEILVEAAANDLFGSGKNDYHLQEACLCIFDNELWQTLLDMDILFNLAENLPQGSVRRQRLLYSLNEACNCWNTDRDKVNKLLHELLQKPANASALTAYSVGHAHLDLAWLWPIRETKRKGGRTFANALRLLEKYPDYVFGASQAQLYQWMKDIYPGLYQEVKTAVKAGRWEVQGASWVEFDTNLSGGESIIRQLVYGRKFFRDEFGITPDTLWLPDCFGYNGNLPQLLKGCGVEHFMTQKLSWNETNVFPHHLFRWQGIDGSEILAHQLPTNDYNFSNNPASFLQTESRYAQSEIAEGFLNLYGIGDGGGGPTANHIEYGKRQQNLEGCPKFKFSPASAFFDYANTIAKELLPKAYGELYLEFHRGTYTTQALMKKNNRISESMLCRAEFLAAISKTQEYPETLANIWKDVLLLQFHDIIPGSSIGWVYKDAAELSAKAQKQAGDFIKDTALKFHAELPSTHRNGDSGLRITEEHSYIIFNACNWEVTDWIKVDLPPKDYTIIDGAGRELSWREETGYALAEIKVPAWGYNCLSYVNLCPLFLDERAALTDTLENRFLKVKLSPIGSITGIIDMESGKELLQQESNLLQLWEDEPNNWGAWDINHFYRQTCPQGVSSATLIPAESFSQQGLSRIVHRLSIGTSTIKQTIELRANEALIRISHEVDWKEQHKMLRVQFNPDIQASEATYEIQFGAIKRSTKPKNAWEEAQFEVPALRFADLSDAGRGAALINDCKHGYRIRESQMELALLRSPADVDPEADLHHHSYRYAFYPHTGAYENSDVLPVAHKFNQELDIIPVSALPQEGEVSLYSVISEHIKLETVKPAHDGNGIILRMYEFCGKSGIAQLSLPEGKWTMQEVNLEEADITAEETLTHFWEMPELSFKPFQIKTYRLKRSEP